MKTQSFIRGILWALFCAWVAAILWYFGRRYPLFNLILILKNSLLLVFLILFFTALGRRVLRFWHVQFRSLAEEWSVAFGAGTAVMMLVIFALAVVGGLYEFVIMPLILLLFGIVYQDARHLCMQTYRAWAHTLSSPKTATETTLLVLMGAAGLLSFLAAATPPFFFDALLYHVAVPQKYLLLHRFHYIPHQPYSNLPINFGMLVIIARSFSDGMLAKLLAWAYLPLTALAVYAFARSRWNRRIALTAATIMSAVPGCLIVTTITAVDNIVMFYAFLCVFALFSWFTVRKGVWLVWAGIFCSVAIGVKYQAVVLAFVPAVFLLAIHDLWVERRRRPDVARNTVVFWLVSLTGVVPWMLKNLVYTGNPFYPFFNRFFGSYASYNVDYGELMRRIGNPFYAYALHLLQATSVSFSDIVSGIVLFIKVPWSFTMHPSGAAGQIGAVFLLCLPGILLLRRTDRCFKLLLIGSVVSLWLWALTLPWIQRYAFPVLPLLSLVTAYIVWNLPLSGIFRRIVPALLVFALTYQIGIFMSEEIRIIRPFQFLFGNQSTTEFLLDHGVNYYPVIQYVNRETSPDAKILFVAESRGYYCERDYVLYTVIEGIDDRELPLRNLIIGSKDIQDLLQTLRAAEFTHILLNSTEMVRYTETYLDRSSYLGLTAAKDQQMIQQLLSPPYTREQITQNGVRLYEIEYP